MVIYFVKSIWHQYFEGSSWCYLNLQGDTQGHGGNSEISAFFGRKIPNAILPFPCSFDHNRLGALYFFEDLLHPFVRKLFLHLKEATLHLQWENQSWTCQFLVAFEI